MTDVVIPSTSRPVSSEVLKGALMNASFGDWVVPTDQEHYVTHLGLTGAPLNAFDQSSSSTSLTVTIDTGEAYIGGAWLGRDDVSSGQGDVTLDASLAGQEVAVGPQYQTSDGIRVDLVQNFAAEEDFHIVWEFDTDGTGVISATDRRTLGFTDNIAHIDDDEIITGSWTHQDTLHLESSDAPPTLHIHGANATDSEELIIDGDADAGQDDDLLKVRSIGDPRDDNFTDSDTVFVTKGDGRVGVNIHNPGDNFEVNGSTGLRGNVLITGSETNINGQLIVNRGGRQVFINETDGPRWLLEAQNDSFGITEEGVEEWLEIDAAQNHRVEMPGGLATIAARLTPQSSPPPVIQNGTLAVQDGSGWDPAGTGQLELLVYLGGWVTIT